MKIENQHVRRKYRIFLTYVLLLTLVFVGALYFYLFDKKVPDKLEATKDCDFLKVSVPFAGNVVSNKTDEKDNEYTLEYKLFNVFSIKKTKVNVVPEEYLIPCGNTVGIYLKTDGVMVIDIGNVKGYDGVVKSPCADILYPGDYILSINGTKVYSKKELSKVLSDCCEKNGGEVLLEVRRDKEIVMLRAEAKMDEHKEYKLGVWVRDDCQGLGTLTYIDGDGNFGALGHKVSDTDTGRLVEAEGGTLYSAKIWSIRKGSIGTPGEVVGSINYGDDNKLGRIEDNENIGIYGSIAPDFIMDNSSSKSCAVPICHKQDVQRGNAYLRSDINGEVRDYLIEITSTDMSKGNTNKGITFKVLDEELIELTGGIVQGMSGSPILQNGKIVGAVTHVFVNDPTKGYGIFIDVMLEENR